MAGVRRDYRGVAGEIGDTPLPPEIQSYITFTGGISTKSKSVDVAEELMALRKSPSATGVMRPQGMEPGE